MKRLLVCAALGAFSLQASAQVQLSKIFGDSMILQRNQPIPVWGWAGKGEKITLQFHQQTQTVKAGKDGRWQCTLNPEAAGGPWQMVVKGKNTITLNGILTGDVWVCSGQSNMEFHVRDVVNSAREIQQANFPQIRHCTFPRDISGKPKADARTAVSWNTATPANVGDFTAVGYFFARALNTDLHVPIGLIHTSWGGTDVEAWISREGFKTSPAFSHIASLPIIDTDSLANIRKQAFLKDLDKLQGGLPAAGVAATWKNPGTDDHNWPAMHVPGLWEQQQLNNFDGIVWFRKTINVDAVDAGKPAELNLGPIDDIDETYINGTAVGTTNGYQANRIYKIPAGVLKAGANSIAVRITDTGGGGGFYGNAAELTLTIDHKEQPLSGSWAFQVESVQDNAQAIGPNSYPSLLYNAMINPILPFAIKGVIWYQGENNSSRAYEYRTAFPLLITDWRKQWNQGNFPFYFVQLASFNAAGGNSAKGSSWAELREAQTMALSLPNTGMAVITDIGEPGDIHPKNKQDVGSRLAAIALHGTYEQNIVYTGPVYESMKTIGNRVSVYFTQTGSGLGAKDKYGYIKGFEMAGADRHFFYAKAYVEGDHVIVFTDEVPNPVAVRYNWADDAGEGNLYNKEGFPAAPFRTDQWKGITEGVKYKVEL